MAPVKGIDALPVEAEGTKLFRCTRFGCTRRYSESDGYFDADRATASDRRPACSRHSDAPPMFVAEVEAGVYRYVCSRVECAATIEYSVPFEFRKPMQRAAMQASGTSQRSA
jgi:hypothetical protein